MKPPSESVLVPDLLFPHALTASQERVFWAALEPNVPALSEDHLYVEPGREQIMSARLDGSDVQVLVRPTRVEHLVLTLSAVVWSHGDHMETACQDGIGRRQLGSFPGLHRLAALDEDALLAFNDNGQPVIARVILSSSEHRVLLRGQATIKHMLVVGERLVWSERCSNIVRVARPDGTFARVLFEADDEVCALAEWSRDVLVATTGSLYRVPLSGKPWRIARNEHHPCLTAAAVAPGALILVHGAVCFSSPARAFGETIHRVSFKKQPTVEPIHELPLAADADAQNLSASRSTVEGIVVRGEAIYFAETGERRHDKGCIQRLPLDTPPIVLEPRNVRSMPPSRMARHEERHRFYEHHLGTSESAKPIAQHLLPFEWRGVIVEGILLNEGETAGLRYTATSGLTNRLTDTKGNSYELGFGYEMILVHYERAAWAVRALAWIVECQMIDLGPREVLDVVEDFGAIPITPIALPDGCTQAFLAIPGCQRIAAAQRFSFGDVRLLCVVAVTEDEFVFASSGGLSALVAMLENAGVAELCDLSRPSVLPRDAARAGRTS